MADLTVTITEDLTINSTAVGGTNSITIASISDYTRKTITCRSATTTKIVSFDTAESTSDMALDVQNVKYVRITNLSATISTTLATLLNVDSGADSSSTSYNIGPGESFILFGLDASKDVEADDTPAFGTLKDVSNILAKPTTSADCQLEIFVASV